MATNRRFCRFSKSPSTASFSVTEIPVDGLCLSSFVILHSWSTPSAVLMGHLNPAAPWDHLGALDAERVAAHHAGWMLPSSHLIFGESPEEAARRILREQLGLGDRPLSGPRVVSEVYAPTRRATAGGHWDLEFLFQGNASDSELTTPEAWTELRFVDTRRVSRAEIARSHDDVLASAGFPVT